MSSAERLPDLRPEGPEEVVFWHCIVWTYGYYLLGALYALAPVVGWVLLVRLARREGLRGVPATVWVWAWAMGLMLLALMVAHADFDLGLGFMLKSMIGWAKGWALISVFIFLGCAQVRLELLARAACLLGVQTLCVLPFLILAWVLGLPGALYVSPVSIVGGPGPEYFAVELYSLSPDSGAPRWRLFAPWAPAIGMVMCVYLVLALNERDTRLRWLGVSGMLVAILLSGSRLGLLAPPIVLGASWLLTQLREPRLYFYAAPITLLLTLLIDPLIELYESAVSRFHGARADSSRVRAALGRIAVERWQSDAFWWGHGNVERGPHLVEYMPIGSHHTWFGTLFVKGLVGAVALALAFALTFLTLMRSGLRTPATRTAMRLLVLLFLYSFAENLEILAYLYWPALVAIGLALREHASQRPAQPHASAHALEAP